MIRRRELLAATAGLGAILSGCSSLVSDGTDVDEADRQSADGTVRRSPAVTASSSPGAFVGYTHLRPSGNRVLSGTGAVPESDPLDVDVPGRPVWVVAAPRSEGSDWAVATADGVIRLVRIENGAVESTSEIARQPPEAPFALDARGDTLAPVERPDDVARWSHAVPVDADRLLYVDRNGDVVLGGNEPTRSPVDALPDARLVRVGSGQYALLAGRTERYDHGALGDSTEAGRIVIADVRDGLTVRTVASIDPPAVIEGIAPIAADVTGDGESSLIVTVADGRRGARLVAYALDGSRLATGPEFSSGYRWRHQLAVGPFGPDGERELVAVQTPHIGGSARFHRRRDDRFEVVASVDGVSSHALGSRNLDGAVGGDLDGDGAWELLVPTQQRDELVGIRHSEDGAEVVWRVPLPGELASNVAGVSLPDGTAAVGAAGSAGTLRIWQP